MISSELIVSIVNQLKALPALLLVLFALPLVVLAWWKQIYPGNRLLSLLLLPALPTLGVILPQVNQIALAICTIAIPIAIWMYRNGDLSGWTVVYVVLIEVTSLLAVAFDPLRAMVIVDFLVAGFATFDLTSIARQRDFLVERNCQKSASLKKSHPVALTISNTSKRKRVLEVCDDLPQEFTAKPPTLDATLPAKSRIQLKYKMVASRRGAFSMDRIFLRSSTRWAFWNRIIRKECENKINVYPDMKQLAEFELLARTNRLSLVGVRRTRRIGQDNDFERLRDYTLDDNYKHIDWRSTARRQKLTVRDFQTSQSQRVIFMIDCGRMMTNKVDGISMLDHSLNAMLMLSYVALQRGDAVGLLCFSDRIHSFVPPRSGKRQMNHLLQSSFDRFPELVESRYSEAFFHLSKHCRKRSLVIMVTNLIDEINANQIHKHLSTMVGRHLPLGVLLRDQDLFAAADTNWRTDRELYRAAAASEIVCWRHDVIRDLKHQGVLALDLPPENMTAPLINQYLEVKARHLL